MTVHKWRLQTRNGPTITTSVESGSIWLRVQINGVDYSIQLADPEAIRLREVLKSALRFRRHEPDEDPFG